MRVGWPIAGALLGAATLFGIVTFLALESNEVILVRTTDADSRTRQTRTWVADDGPTLLVEAANPEREFYRDLLQQPNIEVVRGGRPDRYRAAPLPQPEGHELVRRRLREKYGWADMWVGLLADISGSVAVRLSPQ